jgi:hypothetical protein
MRKLCLMILALTLSLAMLAISVAPAAAAKPDPKNPVAWVESNVNTANDTLPAVKTMHALSVKLFADGSTKGNYVLHDFLAVTKGWAVDNPYYPYFGHEGKIEFAYFWYDDTGARMADIALYVYYEGMPPQYPAALVRIRIADYGQGQASETDWHRWWEWSNTDAEGNPVGYWYWKPSFGGMAIPYFHGNAQIHGDLTGMAEPAGLDLLPYFPPPPP